MFVPLNVNVTFSYIVERPLSFANPQSCHPIRQWTDVDIIACFCDWSQDLIRPMFGFQFRAPSESVGGLCVAVFMAANRLAPIHTHRIPPKWVWNEKIEIKGSMDTKVFYN